MQTASVFFCEVRLTAEEIAPACREFLRMAVPVLPRRFPEIILRTVTVLGAVTGVAVGLGDQSHSKVVWRRTPRHFTSCLHAASLRKVLSSPYHTPDSCSQAPELSKKEVWVSCLLPFLGHILSHRDPGKHSTWLHTHPFPIPMYIALPSAQTPPPSPGLFSYIPLTLQHLLPGRECPHDAISSRGR